MEYSVVVEMPSAINNAYSRLLTCLGKTKQKGPKAKMAEGKDWYLRYKYPGMYLFYTQTHRHTDKQTHGERERERERIRERFNNF